MAASILVREALRRVSTLLLDTAPQFKRWGQVELIDWLNDAQAAIAKYLPQATSRIDAIKLKTGSLQSIDAVASADIKQFDGSSPGVTLNGNLLLGVLCNMGSDGLTEGRAIRGPVDMRAQDGVAPDWRLQAYGGSLIKAWGHDPESPRYFQVDPPVKASATVWARIRWCIQPIKVPNVGTEDYTSAGSNATTLSVPDEYIDEVVHYVVARAHMKECEWADGGKAAFFAALFTSAINGKAEVLTGHNPNLKRLPFAPAPPGAAA
jgi:hypothetical protein